MPLYKPAAAILSAALLLAAAQAGEHCRAIDGDTIRCGVERVRLLGVYAPERGEAGYERARERLAARLLEGAVRIERRGRDRYGRTLGVVFVDGRVITQRDVGACGGRGLAASSSWSRCMAASGQSASGSTEQR